MTLVRTNLKTLSEAATPDEQKDLILANLGDLDQYDMLDDDVLVALYGGSNILSTIKTHDGKTVQLVGTDQRTSEQRFQGKAGLLIKAGPTAWRYMPNGQPYEGDVPKPGDWLAFYAHDGREIAFKDLKAREHVICRLLKPASIKMRLTDPRLVY